MPNRGLTAYDEANLASIVRDVVDHLQPHLKPYEAALYWYLLRNTFLAGMSDIILTSRTRLGKNVIVSRSGRSNDLSDSAVAKALRGMQAKGLIEQVGESSKKGTPYRVFLPCDIEICQDSKRRSIENEQAQQTVSVDELVDYYNVESNRRLLFERDGYCCTYCGKQLTQKTATLDHLVPVADGGENDKDNLTTSCIACNSKRRNRPVQDAVINGESRA